MTPLTAEWVTKAEGDLVTARRELRARRLPNFDAACFHAQQAAEKYLKALLQERGATFPRTHNLIELLELGLGFESGLEFHRAQLQRLDQYAVRYRYPGDAASRVEARSAVVAAEAVRDFARTRLGLS